TLITQWIACWILEQTLPHHLLLKSDQSTDTPPASLLKNLVSNQASKKHDRKIKLDKSTLAPLFLLMENEAAQKRQLQTIVEEMAHLRQRIQTIKAGQLMRAKLTPVPSYPSRAAKSKGVPLPPTKAEMVSIQPGLTIIHDKTGTKPLKGEPAEKIVRKTNEILESSMWR
ncbi:hypothetical protein PSTT_04429, partial [Puccinia striiformis]